MGQAPRSALITWLLVLASMCAARSADFNVPPTPHQYVTDGAGALTEATRTALESELRSYEASTGHQIIVWIGQTTGDVPLELWTAETAHTWRIGRRGLDDGAVLFVFMSDRKVRIEVGYGLEGALSDADAKRIIDEQIVPAMRSGDTNRAIADGVRAILTTITPAFAVSVGAGPRASATIPPETLVPLVRIFVPLMFAIPVCLFVLFVFLAVRRPGGRGGGSDDETFSTSSDDDSSSSSDFDAGGGDFGGGGASGSW